MTKFNSRFLECISLGISFKDFTEVMQEILDDATLELDNDRSELYMYSKGNDADYYQEELLERLSLYLGVKIEHCVFYPIEENIYLICSSEVNDDRVDEGDNNGSGGSVASVTTRTTTANSTATSNTVAEDTKEVSGCYCNPRSPEGSDFNGFNFGDFDNVKFSDEDFGDVFRLYDWLSLNSKDSNIIPKLMLCSEMRFFSNLQGKELYQASNEIFQDWLSRDDSDLTTMVMDFVHERGCAI
ncbi:MAG: hypothetical protein FWD97_05040 [Defluviitaleaceae bacterium]|nr:hypothetical protein [Defluviitaleaceae bacterium]